MDDKKILPYFFITIRQDDKNSATQRILAAFTSLDDMWGEITQLKEKLGPSWKISIDNDIPLDQTIQYPIKTDIELDQERTARILAEQKALEPYTVLTGFSRRYDTAYNIETGEWLEKIGFCSPEEKCCFCDAYRRDGSPKTAFGAPREALT